MCESFDVQFCLLKEMAAYSARTLHFNLVIQCRAEIDSRRKVVTVNKASSDIFL